MKKKLMYAIDGLKVKWEKKMNFKKENRNLTRYLYLKNKRNENLFLIISFFL